MAITLDRIGKLLKVDTERIAYYFDNDGTRFEYNKDNDIVTYELFSGLSGRNVPLSELILDGSAPTNFATFETKLALVYPQPSGGGGGGTSDATAANQTAGNESLSSIDSKFTALNAKDFSTQTTLAAVLAKIIAAPSTEAKQDTQITDLGGVTETAPSTDTASSGLNGRLQRIAQRITSLIAQIPASLGIKTAAASMSVVLASDATIPSHAVTNAGVFAVQSASAGDTAHDAADAGNPIKVGAKAIGSLATTTLVAGGDRANNQSDTDGALLIRNQIPLADLITETVTNTNGTSTAFANFTAVASTKNYVMSIVITNTSTTGGTIDFRDGTGGAVLWTMPVPPASTNGPGGAILPAGSVPYFKNATAATALAFDVSGALTTVTISISGFQSKIL